MAQLYLIRHGHAAAGWDEDPDPDLDGEGRSQAQDMAAALGPRGPLGLVSSPLRRTRSTAAALESAWGCAARVDPRVGEIPTPTGPAGAMARRGEWLAGVMAGRWDDEGLPSSLAAWRAGVIEALLELEEDTVVVTHFVAVNVAVGQATDNARTVVFAPGYCSRTILSNEGGRLAVLELGAQGRTVVR